MPSTNHASRPLVLAVAAQFTALVLACDSSSGVASKPKPGDNPKKTSAGTPVAKSASHDSAAAPSGDPTHAKSATAEVHPKAAGTEGAAKGAKKVHCYGVNTCKGTSACHVKGAHTCAGQNACAGKGWLLLTSADCTARKGTTSPS